MTTTERVGLREAAERLGVHYMTVYHYVRTGRLAAEREGATWLVRRADLEALAAPGARPAATRTPRPARLAERMVRGDEAGAWAIVEGAMASGASPAAVYEELLVPALRGVGDRWAAGTISVADEHRASVVATRVIGRMGPRFARRGRARGSVVLGGPAGESHALPVAIVADLLRAAHLEPIDLGANAPADSFAETAAGADRLVAVLVGVTAEGLEESVRETIGAVARRVEVPVLVGGRAIRDRAHALSLGAAGWTGHSAAGAVAAVESLLA